MNRYQRAIREGVLKGLGAVQGAVAAAKAAGGRVRSFERFMGSNKAGLLALGLVLALASPARAVSTAGNPVTTYLFWLVNIAGGCAVAVMAIKSYFTWTDLDNQGENIWKLAIGWGGIVLTWVGLIYWIRNAGSTGGQQLQGITDMTNMR